jgi:hypothetical protein
MLPWTWARMGLPAASYRTWMVWMPLTSKTTSKPQAALAPSSMKVSSWGIRKVSGGVANAAVGTRTARAAAMPMTMSVRIGRPRSRLDIGASPCNGTTHRGGGPGSFHPF